jgi:lipopolysaccharide/colanic/teichoic acid biosynthesis glycosyltransferase
MFSNRARWEVSGVQTQQLEAPNSFRTPSRFARRRTAVDADPVCLSVCDARPPRRIERPAARIFKRTFDLVVSVPLAIGVLLVLPVLALVVRLDSAGPVFFSQVRIGRGGRRIKVVKLRSMHRDAERRLRADPAHYQRYVEHGFKLPQALDPRVTRVGRLLRKWSLDELPQVFSVLVGQMSVVGPRPVVPVELESLYGDRAGVYLTTKPGLTGLWQVSGRSKIGGHERMWLDEEYVDRWSPLLDVKLLARTVPAVLTARGAH